MDPVTEVIFMSLKSADDGQTLSQVLNDNILHQPGCLRIRWSPVHEDATKARCFIDWEDISRHEQFMAAPVYQPFLEKVGPFMGGPPQIHHVKFHPFPSSVLDNQGGKGKTPVAELLYLHFPHDESFTPEMKTAATTNAKRFLAEGIPVAKGCTGETAMGWAIEPVEFEGQPCRALVILIGWESVEAHYQFRTTEAFTKNIPLLRGSAGLKGVAVVHVSTTMVERRG